MDRILGLRKSLHNFFLRKKLTKNKTSHQTINFSAAKNIGLLFLLKAHQSTDPVFEISKQLKKEGKSVSLLAYVPKRLKKKQPSPPYPHFTKSDLNFLLHPKNKAVEAFQNEPFDILINAYSENALPLEYISSFSNARFRIGPYKKEKTYYCDFMLHADVNNTDLKETLDQVMHYLKKINSPHG